MSQFFFGCVWLAEVAALDRKIFVSEIPSHPFCSCISSCSRSHSPDRTAHQHRPHRAMPLLRLLCVVVACVTVSVIITAPLLRRPAPCSPPLRPQSPFSVDSILPVYRQPPRRPQPRSRLLPLVLPTPLCPCPRSPFRPPLSIPPRHLSARPALGLPPPRLPCAISSTCE